MNVTVTDINETRKEVVVTISGEEIAQAEQEILKNAVKEAKIPGFRPGKAPAHLIRQKYKAHITEELQRKVSQDAYNKAIEDSKLEVYSLVSVSGDEDLKPGQEANIDLTVDVTPEFTLPVYSEIPTEVESSEVSDAEIEDALKLLRRQRANYNLVEKPTAEGDYVKLSYTGKIDGTPLAELLPDEPAARIWGTQTNTWEEASSNDEKGVGVKAVVEGLIGMSAGDTKDVEMVLPETFPFEQYRGKTAIYSIECHEVRECVLPEIDEAFLKEAKAETLEDLKSSIMDSIEGNKKQKQQQQQRQQILNYLGDNTQFPLPESALEEETQNVVNRIAMDNMNRGVPEEEFEKNKEALFAQSREIAEKEVKHQLILSKIAKAEEIQVSEEDLNRGIYMLAYQNRIRPEEVVKELKKDRQRLFHLQRQLLLNKTLDFLIDKAKLVVKNG